MQGNEPLTILGEGTAEFTVQRSRFIAYVAAVHDEEEAHAFVSRLRKEHYDARHCCSAWILGADGAKQRKAEEEHKDRFHQNFLPLIAVNIFFACPLAF